MGYHYGVLEPQGRPQTPGSAPVAKDNDHRQNTDSSQELPGDSRLSKSGVMNYNCAEPNSADLTQSPISAHLT